MVTLEAIILDPNAIIVGRMGIWPGTVTNQKTLLSAIAAISQAISQEIALKVTAKPLWSAINAMNKGILPNNAKVESL